MATTLEQLQAQRDAVLASLANPSHIQFRDRSVTLCSQPELEAALKRIDTEIAALRSPQPRQFVIQTSRGI